MMRWLILSTMVGNCALTPVKPELVAPSLAARSSATEQALQLALPRYPGREPWALSSYRGRVVLLDVWATWCEPCRDALPLYQDLRREFAPRGLEVFTINIDADSKTVGPFLQETKVELPVLLDPEAHVSESALKVKLMPTAFLIDKRGVIRHVHEGFDEGQLSTWLAEIEALLAEPAP